MFWAVCSLTLGALLGDNWGILFVFCLYTLLRPQPVEEPVYYLSSRWTPPSATPNRISSPEQAELNASNQAWSCGQYEAWRGL
jgi:hypothetical protein